MGNNGMLKALALATQLGFAVACPLVAFIAGGVWADGQLGTRPWLFFLGLLLGLLAAAGALYQLAVAQPARRRDPAAGKAPDKIERTSGDVGTNRAGKKRDKS
jgi:F0F1-type ATP synthase assembly protein I